ncbi:MAG: universal stress protein [Microlunatus sp.]
MSEAKTIIVGVDGSQPSLKALRWAADQAAAENAELVVLCAWSVSPSPAATPDFSYSVHAGGESSADQAKNRLMGAITEVLGENPRVVVQPEVKEGGAAKVLIEAATERRADLLVVGTRGLGGFGGLLLGSVSQHVAVHAGCTVVIVR